MSRKKKGIACDITNPINGMQFGAGKNNSPVDLNFGLKIDEDKVTDELNDQTLIDFNESHKYYHNGKTGIIVKLKQLINFK